MLVNYRVKLIKKKDRETCNYVINVYDDLEIDFQKKLRVITKFYFQRNRFNALQTLNCV